MAASRGEFSSRIGFIMAAAGSAVGLGNIWGFPTQAASNGGAAFLLVYLVLAFFLAYPAFMAELIIGRHAQSNAVAALGAISSGPGTRRLGVIAGIYGVIIASLILSFYAIVAGWMIAHFLEPVFLVLGMNDLAAWLVGFGLPRNVLFMVGFMALTVFVINSGVQNGIEKWSTRLMPVLLLILAFLIVYVLTLDGASEGLRAYLVPDFSRVFEPKLIISALGSAFFSMSLGVGTMLIYGSYINKDENLPLVGGLVTIADISIAVLAGFLVIPAMYVAMHNGVAIFDASGALISEDTLIFTVLPALFDTMGQTGLFVSFAFFILMSIAALTSSISMLEVPVAYAIENHSMSRGRAVLLAGGGIALASFVVLLSFNELFGFVVALTTRYSQPALGFIFCIFVGWIWNRNAILKELQSGNPDVEHSLFWKIWPTYVRFVCPLMIGYILYQNI